MAKNTKKHTRLNKQLRQQRAVEVGQKQGPPKAKNPNSNFLQGKRCPKCGSFGPFSVEAVRYVEVSDDGTQDTGNDTEFGSDSAASCCSCFFDARWGRFDDPSESEHA